MAPMTGRTDEKRRSSGSALPGHDIGHGLVVLNYDRSES
ncbi:hypothetical protein CV83915_3p0035 (plasmid) [Escherichia coli]|uniref:Uncharacterized protein n=1 Tax=Escherichia coli TaxID=562 RepID=A0A2H4TLB0_ECOLX|nr:hypothetical protein CV83915_3p0035 [Escherichia coli]